MSTKKSLAKSPAMRDSDVIFLIVKRLEIVGTKMQRYEYDDDLDRLMVEASEWFEWLGSNLVARNAKESA